MLQDQKLSQAVAAIPARSERQQDLQKLVGAFVDVGILPQVRNNNNQVFYGRRGTGKTHVLRVLASKLQNPQSCVIYLDSRILGSTAQFTDSSLPLSLRCTALFRDFLGEIHNGLLDQIVTLAPEAADSALEHLSHLGVAATEPASRVVGKKGSERVLLKRTEESASGIGIGTSFKTSGLTASSSSANAIEEESSTGYEVVNEEKIIFPAVTSAMRSVLTTSGLQLYVLIDEWSSLPSDVQPYLAEFLKRTFFALPAITLKIACLEYRSVFRTTRGSDTVGFELGADISAGLDIDDYYVVDRNPERITDAFGDMLVNHLRNELPDGYLDGLGISNGAQLGSKLFTERAVFQELVRASEGVARDLINIFSTAYYAAHRKGREKIERNAVLEGARQWFEQDKEGNLDAPFDPCFAKSQTR